LTFLFDNNLPPALSDALRLLDKAVLHVRDVKDLGGAAPDDLILDYAATWGHVLVTRDRAMRQTPHFRALLGAKKLGVVFVSTGGSRQLNAWQIAKLLVKAWDEIERYAGTQRRAFICLVQQNGRVTQG
jgi:predicted nuclease of predicted toxin-antitoxin system